MRRIGVVTVARSDYGIYRPLLRLIEDDPALELCLLVGGAHWSPEFGRTASEIEADGFPIAAPIEMSLSSDSPEGAAKTMGLGTIGFAQAYARLRPDLLLLLGDRMEMLAAALAAVPFNLPLAHIHGGESSEGAMDEVFRHAMTKLSHLHFVATPEYGARVVQMGEEPWRVTVSGAPGLDNLRNLPLLSRTQLTQRLGWELAEGCLLVTWHPATLQPDVGRAQTEALLTALQRSGRPLLFTYPGADTHGRAIISRLEVFVSQHTNSKLVAHLGTQNYFSVMALADAMVGNSSSGLIEAASFQLPVVNVGERQHGRIRGANVVDCAPIADEIEDAIRKALNPGFRAGWAGLANPYGDGRAAERIRERLISVPLGIELLRKRFHRIDAEASAGIGIGGVPSARS